MNPRTLFFCLLITFFSASLMGQEDEHDHYHDHHKNEIGIANAPVYFLKEKVVAYGLHLHYVRTVKDSKFGLGLGYEHIFDEHKHTTLGVVGSYRPLDGLIFNVSPGVTFEEYDTSELNFALHLEASYELELGEFHIGPVAEIAYDPEDYHLSLGLHVGFGF